VVGNVRLVDGTQGNNKVLISDANGNASWQKFIAGYVLIGDVASGISTAVGGDIAFASKSNSGSSSTITVNFADQGNTNFVPMISLVSLGTADDDDDVETPVILNITSTSFDIFLNETNGTTQDLRINILLIPFWSLRLTDETKADFSINRGNPANAASLLIFSWDPFLFC